MIRQTLLLEGLETDLRVMNRMIDNSINFKHYYHPPAYTLVSSHPYKLKIKIKIKILQFKNEFVLHKE
jgi:hypothetical protein